MSFITPQWPAPAGVKAYFTTRSGGVSEKPYDSFNLGTHVEDSLEHVLQNRRILQETLHLSSEPVWLNQVHSNRVIRLSAEFPKTVENADAAYTTEKNKICTVLTADCLPVLLCNKEGTEIAAVHGGWRGLASNIISKALLEFNCAPENILAWLGPAIGPEAFELGIEVKEQFCAINPLYEKAFREQNTLKCLGDIYEIARIQLALCGVTQVYGGDFCTYKEKDRFFSFRREKTTGRMAAMIWRV